jgi:hypothetical protein
MTALRAGDRPQAISRVYYGEHVMLLKLQVNENGEWGTLSTRFASEKNEEEVAKVLAELAVLQSSWSSSYGRYSNATFRIAREK